MMREQALKRPCNAGTVPGGGYCLGTGSAPVEKQAVDAGGWGRITNLARRFREEARKARRR